MSTILESLAHVRELLDFPKSNKPSTHQRYGAVVRNVQGMYNRLSNTTEAWAIGEKIITLSPSCDTFTISRDESFGKILLVTTYSNSPFAVEREIDFFAVQNMPFDWDMPNNYYGGWFNFYSGGYHNAERMAVYYDAEGALKLQVKPFPFATAQYRVKYSIGNWADRIQLDSSPVLTQFHDIFEIRAAKDVLYMSEWEGFSKAENIEKREEIKPGLDEQEKRYLPDFEAHISKMTQSKLQFKSAWDD